MVHIFLLIFVEIFIMNTSVIMGTLLGDAWIYKEKNKKCSYSFRFSQSNKQYALWKAEQVGLPFTIYERNRFDKRTSKIYYCCEILIKMDKKEKEYLYNLFYSPKKTITNEILEKLDHLAICIWYLDDGNMYYNGNNCHLSLAVDGFSIEERKLIINYFKNNYNLNFKYSKEAIRITSRKECEIFMNIVGKYIPESMYYKKLSSAIEKHDKTLTDEQRKYRTKKYKK